MKIKAFLKKKRAGILHFLSSLLLLAIAAGIGIFIALKETNGLGKYVDTVYEYYQDSNWMALYKFSEVEADGFINEQGFWVMAEALYGEIEKENLSLGQVTEEGDKAVVELHYKNGDKEEETWKITLTKKPETNYIFFHQWKLDVEEMILKDCSVTAPKGMVVYMDGIELTSDNAVITTDSANNMVTYSFPQVFMGKHVFYVEDEAAGFVEEEVEWTADGSQCVCKTAQ